MSARRGFEIMSEFSSEGAAREKGASQTHINTESEKSKLPQHKPGGASF